MFRDRREKAKHGSTYLLSLERRPSVLLPWESAFAEVSSAVCVAALYPADTVKRAMQTKEELCEMRAYQKHASSVARDWSTSTSLGPPLTQASSSSSSTSFPTSSFSIRSVSFLQMFLEFYHAYGAKGLYNGCSMSIAREIPSSGIVFFGLWWIDSFV
ncbi:hypothetical protein BT96DRAFT_836397 [Gymnopus androsaceus JB14]|uniref:ADP,ATP carrier protein n=1 Tax=Gymnopus androsaceus JB14 TaxID=1447944 RepID=A0A6A4GRB5_9AGAR|nr:hypothetical protein BT96DRAFT_836397 [Gymnopus androsaceus JB14]